MELSKKGKKHRLSRQTYRNYYFFLLRNCPQASEEGQDRTTYRTFKVKKSISVGIGEWEFFRSIPYAY